MIKRLSVLITITTLLFIVLISVASAVTLTPKEKEIFSEVQDLIYKNAQNYMQKSNLDKIQKKIEPLSVEKIFVMANLDCLEKKAPTPLAFMLTLKVFQMEDSPYDVVTEYFADKNNNYHFRITLKGFFSEIKLKKINQKDIAIIETILKKVIQDTSDDPAIRGEAITGLAYLTKLYLNDKEGGVFMNKKRVGDIFLKNLKEKDELILCKAASALGIIGARQASDQLLQIIKSWRNYEARTVGCAAKTLEKFGDTRVIEPISEILEITDDEMMFAYSYQALEGIKDKRIIKPLLKNVDRFPRKSTLRALGKNKELLVEVIKGNDTEYLVDSLKALELLKAKDTLPLVLKNIDHENREVRKASLQTLRVIGDNSILPTLEARKKSEKDPEIKKYLDSTYNVFNNK